MRYLNGFLLAWLQRLAIQPPRDKKLVTLKDAVGYIIALPKSKQQAPERQAAAEALFDGGDASRAMMVASLSSSKSDLLVALRRQRPRAVVRRGPNVGRQHHKAGRCDLVSVGLAFHEAGLSSLTPDGVRLAREWDLFSLYARRDRRWYLKVRTNMRPEGAAVSHSASGAAVRRSR